MRKIHKNHELIVTIVEKGTSDDVVKYAKQGGAEGATVLHGRGSGIHDMSTFFGIVIEPEKEVVLTLVPTTIVKPVLKSIATGIDIDKPGNGVAFVIDVAKVIGIPHLNLLWDNDDDDDDNNEE